MREGSPEVGARRSEQGAGCLGRGLARGDSGAAAGACAGTPVCMLDPGFREAQLGAQQRDGQRLGEEGHSEKGWAVRGWLGRPGLGLGLRAGSARVPVRPLGTLSPCTCSRTSVVHIEEFDGGARSKKGGGLLPLLLTF